MSTQMMNQKIADYFKTQPIERAWLFGSCARGEETPISDVDILVQFDEGGVSLLKHAAMICYLEKILDRPVDIVPEKALRPRVRESINQDKKLIYYGIVKNIEIVGEAAYKLTSVFRRQHPDTPWDVIMKMRHVLVHDYYQIE